MQNNFIFELIPLVVFFSVYYFTKDMFIATGVLIIASWIQLIFYKLKFKHVAKNTLISTLLITVFGGLTILFHNKTFVMLKPTVLFAIVGTSLLVSQILGKNAIRLMLGKEITLPDNVWKRLNIMWIFYFYVMSVVNLYVAFNYSEYFWVKFKVFGVLGATILYTIISGLYVYKHYKKKI